MIFLGTISDTIIESHWNYFISSNGYLRLTQLALDPAILQAERDYYQRLIDDENILKAIIIGKPEYLIKEIQHYQTHIVNNIPLLTQYQIFLSSGNWDQISEKINTKAEIIAGKDEVLERKREYCETFVDLKNVVAPALFADPAANAKITIKLLKSIFSKLKNHFLENLNQFYARIYSVFHYDAVNRQQKVD